MAVPLHRLPYEGLARAAQRLADGADLREAFELLAEAVLEGTNADLVVVRVLDEESGLLVARTVAPAESPEAAEASGSRRSPDELAAADGTLVFPVLVGGRQIGAIELRCPEGELDEPERMLAELAAAQLGLSLGARAGSGPLGGGLLRRSSRIDELARAGDALAAGGDVARAAQQAARIAVELTGARACAIWRLAGERLEPAALHGDWPADALGMAKTLAGELPAARKPLLVEHDPDGDSCTVSIQLGQPAFGVLQLRYAQEPSPAELTALASFSARVAHALRLGQRAREMELERDRTRALLSVVGEAIARLSVAHTLETAVERIADLLGTESVGIYLREEGRLRAAAVRHLPEGHEEVAFGLFELALGPLRAREAIEVRRRSRGAPMAPVAQALAASGAQSVLGVPLRVRDEAIGLLVAYPGDRRSTDEERSLLSALAAQLAVAVQNARLHEEAKELGDALASVLEIERQTSRRLGALYEISSAFASSLSLERTIETVTTTIVEVLAVDAAAISVPDERGDTLIPTAVHVADGRMAEAVRTILTRPQPAHLRPAKPLVLDVASAERLGGGHALLVPFLEKGSTAVVLPIVSPTELLALLTIVSLDPENPISAETVATAVTIAAQATLAIDNARLYQQQKAFAETIQRALLPRRKPAVRGLEVGAVYQSAARVDVGGDLYDFLELGEDRLAVVLGDVTGHGVDATADMAMAKFVFRSLAREHPAPGDFLAHANDVVAEEMGTGKFITMACMTLDAAGRLACASAGHPGPRIVLPDGRVESLDCGGLALGIDPGQVYEEGHTELPPGGSIVLYTDGVTEARSGRELYGLERLDALLSARCALPPQELAEAVLAECRAFAGGELSDDCALVVVRRT